MPMTGQTVHPSWLKFALLVALAAAATAFFALGADPEFALLFPCMGRGPNFFGNRDLDSLRSRFPGLPIIGMYGNGEIGPLDGANHLFQYSVVLGLFKAAAVA